MVDNVTVGSVCAQSPSFMPELDGEKNKTQLIVDDIVAYLKNPSVYSFEKEGPLNHFFNNCSEIEPWVLIGGGLIIIVSTSEQDPESLIVTVGILKESMLHRFPYHLRLQHPSKIFLFALIRTQMMRVLLKSRKKLIVNMIL